MIENNPLTNYTSHELREVLHGAENRMKELCHSRPFGPEEREWVTMVGLLLHTCDELVRRMPA